MKEDKGFKFAYLGVIVLILCKYFYEWIFEKNLNYFLLSTIVFSSILFIFGNILNKKR